MVLTLAHKPSLCCGPHPKGFKMGLPARTAPLHAVNIVDLVSAILIIAIFITFAVPGTYSLALSIGAMEVLVLFLVGLRGGDGAFAPLATHAQVAACALHLRVQSRSTLSPPGLCRPDRALYMCLVGVLMHSSGHCCLVCALMHQSAGELVEPQPAWSVGSNGMRCDPLRQVRLQTHVQRASLV